MRLVAHAWTLWRRHALCSVVQESKTETRLPITSRSPNMQSAASYAILKTTFVREVAIASALAVVGAYGWYVCSCTALWCLAAFCAVAVHGRGVGSAPSNSPWQRRWGSSLASGGLAVVCQRQPGN